MSGEVFPILIMFVILILALATGAPLAFSIGGTALLCGLLFFGPSSLGIIATSTLGIMTNFVLICLPLFILMAQFLQRSGIADDLYGLMYNLVGRIRGGLASGTVIICTLFAAMSGVSAAATVSMGVISLPSMLKRNYNKTIAMGCISAGGSLGILIPPSVTMIVFSLVSGISVGRLFAGGIFAGLLLSTLFITYITVRCYLNPSLAPAIPPEERVPLRAVLPLTRALILPIILVIAVLGSIFTGLATPTEAAAVGAFGAIICAGIHRRLNFSLVKECCNETLRLTVLILWIIVCATWFATIFAQMGGHKLALGFIQSLGVNRWVILIGIQLVLVLAGMFIEEDGIILILGPIFCPIIAALGFDPLWFGILFVINLEMALLTPPFGYNLFYLKAIVPKGITMADIYRSIIPFVGIQAIGMIIIMCFPQIATFLPNLIFG